MRSMLCLWPNAIVPNTARPLGMSRASLLSLCSIAFQNRQIDVVDFVDACTHARGLSCQLVGYQFGISYMSSALARVIESVPPGGAGLTLPASNRGGG